MQANNWQRLKIWQQIENKTSYTEFTAACAAAGVEPQHMAEFARQVGTLLVAEQEYPQLSLEDGFTSVQIGFLFRTPVAGNSAAPVVESMPESAVTPCGGCRATVVEQSRGLGDTVARITHATGLDKLAEMYTKITGKPCGCAERQEALNKLLPYGIKEEN